MDFSSLATDFLLVRQTLAPSPSPLPGVSDFVDVKSVTSDVVAGLVLASVIGLLSLLSKRVRGFYANWFKRLASLGRWAADKWTTLKTPVNTIPQLRKELKEARAQEQKWRQLAAARQESEAEKARRVAALESEVDALRMSPRQLDDLTDEELNQWCEIKGYQVTRKGELKLPPRWSFSIRWDDWEIVPGKFTLTNRGPGTAYHVMVTV